MCISWLLWHKIYIKNLVAWNSKYCSWFCGSEIQTWFSWDILTQLQLSGLAFDAVCWLGYVTSAGSATLLHIVAPCQKGKSKSTNLQASLCIMFSDVPLVEASHMDNPRLIVGGDTQGEKTRRHCYSLLQPIVSIVSSYNGPSTGTHFT